MSTPGAAAQVASEVGWFSQPPGLRPVAPAVRTCYEVLDLCRACGITDFTDGKYLDARNDRAAYLEAQRLQAEYLLDEVDCRAGSRLLDIGCGYGRILQAAARRQAVAVGITISPRQVDYCRRRGLNVNLCNYRDLVCGGRQGSWVHAFDGIVANGSLEHFVQAEDAAAGRADAIYREFFEICRRLLRDGGKLATTAIHARYVGQLNPCDLLAGPARWPPDTLNYYAANLRRSFGGWGPEPAQLESAAAGLFRLVRAEDGTRDYFQTSEYWTRQIKRSLALSPRAWWSALFTFARRPRATLRMLRCLLWDQSWTAQFREPAPAQLWRHTWTAQPE